MGSPDQAGAQANNAYGNATQNITHGGDIVLESPEEVRRRAKHNRFVRIGIALGLVVAATVGIVVFQIEQDSQTSNDLARSGPELKSNLAASQVSAYIEGGIDGEEYDASVQNAARTKVNLYGPHIDITLGNIANGTSLVTKASITFNRLQSLKSCAAVGGQLVVSANYQFQIPDNQQPVPPAKPFTLTKPISYEVTANKHDRLMLTVGLPAIPDGNSPWLGVVDVILEHDGGQQLKIGPIALVDTGSNSEFYPAGDKWKIPDKPAAGCIDENIKLVSEVLKTPNLVVSREVAGLDRALRNFKASPTGQPKADVPSPFAPGPAKTPPTGQDGDGDPSYPAVDPGVYTLL
ncbi:hypothetical protein AB0F92_22760 [Kitasatospora aureofaciens]|uniref:hypothetical protein n=1 Tax=Kitasatospora aureofaciens TaxID=1894 RepID=UPI0011610EDD|nr:hypothetical protein BOQ63_012465 [Streptomyces viridifaciens]